jgi:wyosine [tRNA(Phe)-imidazoG37] synthetase (radical SAM superfamily)
MDSTNSHDLIDQDRLERFRMVLAEYDIVATGIKSLSRQLSSDKDDISARLLNQLQSIEKHFSLNRERLWLFQVSDQGLSDLLMELIRQDAGGDPVASLSEHIYEIKMILSPLSHALETGKNRSHELIDDVTSVDRGDRKNINLEHMAYELAFGRTIINSHPIRQVLDTTSRCNLRCLTCHQSETQEVIHYDLADVSLGALDAALDDAKQIFIAGMGETLLSRSAFELIAKAKASGAYVEAITNGTTLGRGSKLIPSVDMLMVSLDGGTAEVYNAIRRNGDFGKLVSSLKTLSADARRKICFNIVVCKQNILSVGHIHFQEMFGYLPWHDRMTIDEAGRSWFFKNLPYWKNMVTNHDISIVCNLVPSTSSSELSSIDIAAAMNDNMNSVFNVPKARLPSRISLTDASQRLEEFLMRAPAPVFEAVDTALRALEDLLSSEDEEIDSSRPEKLDWSGLRKFVETGQARIPHCMSTFAHLIVNGDGTTRSCCKVQSRLADVSQECFSDIWNADPYVELRSAHVKQIAPRNACRDCRDPVRFHFLVETLEVLAAHDIDVSLIRKPCDFPLPASAADHALVRKLGSNTLSVPPRRRAWPARILAGMTSRLVSALASATETVFHRVRRGR